MKRLDRFVLIGLLVGLWDLGALILIFGINVMMNLFGIMMEYHNQYTEKTNWTTIISVIKVSKDM